MTEDILALWMPIATTAIGLGAVVFASRFRRGDLISPFCTSLVLLTAIFGIRPILMFANSSFWFYRLDVADGFDQACLIGLCGVTALCLGYLLGTPSRGRLVETGGTPSSIDASPNERIGMAAAMSGLILVAWVALTAYVGGGFSFVIDTFQGRSSTFAEAYVGVPAGVPALPVAAGIVIALSRIKITRYRRLDLHENLLYWIIILLAIIPPMALGNRRFLIPTVIAGLTGACLRTWKKHVTVGMFAASGLVVFALAVIPYVRSAGSRTEGDGLIGSAADHIGASGVSGVLNDFFLSYDTEMFSYISYVAPRLGTEASDMPFGFGRGTFLELLLAPLPHSALPITTWSNTLLTSIFGGGCGVANCPVPSVFGTLYFDWSYPGLILGCVLIGLLFSRYGVWIHSTTGFRLTLVVLLGAFAPLMVRGNAISQMWIAVQVLFAVTAAVYLGKALSSAFSKSDQQRYPRVAVASSGQSGDVIPQGEHLDTREISGVLASQSDSRR